MPTQPYIVGGKRVPSVTTILGKFKDPGALMWWSHGVANNVLIEALSHIEETVAVLASPNEKQFLGDCCDQRRDLEEFLKTKPLERANFRKVSEDACTAGTICHQLVQDYINELKAGGASAGCQFIATVTRFKLAAQFKTSQEILSKAYESFQAFSSWINQNKFELTHTEQALTSRKHLYGGTLDCIGMLADERILFDWKTSNAVYADYIAQIAGYTILWEENNPKLPIDSTHLLRFDKQTGDFTDHRFAELSEAKEYFLLLRRCYELLKSLEKRV